MKVLLDTNVLIGFFRDPRRKALELFAGCRTARQEKALAYFLKPFGKL
jgi:hypothetical protein